jgi:predicted nucleic acid-binding protein
MMARPGLVLLADVNVFIYAYRPESPRSAETGKWLADVLDGDALPGE